MKLKAEEGDEGYPNDDRSYRTADTVNSRLFGGSRRERSRVEPWDKPEKTRGKLNEKVSWNGNRTNFREYRKKIEGHLLQVSAGYLIDPEFIEEYTMQYAVGTHMAYLQSEPFWSKYSVPFLQARGDRQYLYGILVSSCCQNDNKVILANKKELDGILA
jgi:hypothetical protein